MSTVYMRFTTGESIRVKSVAVERVEEYLSYGWVLENNGASTEAPPAIIPEEYPILLDKVQTMPIVERKRGRPKRGA